MFQGRDLLLLSEEQMREIRGRDIAMIFQEPMTSLNPVLTIGFQIMLRLMPGDPVQMMLDGANVSKEVVDAERARLGLDQPIYLQFIKWLGSALTGDFGYSIWTGKPVLHEIAIRLELSLEVAVLATILAVALALPLGTLSAIFKDTWIDHTIRVFSIAGLAVPSFWLGMIFLLGSTGPARHMDVTP